MDYEAGGEFSFSPLKANPSPTANPAIAQLHRVKNGLQESQAKLNLLERNTDHKKALKKQFKKHDSKQSAQISAVGETIESEFIGMRKSFSEHSEVLKNSISAQETASTTGFYQVNQRMNNLQHQAVSGLDQIGKKLDAQKTDTAHQFEEAGRELSQVKTTDNARFDEAGRQLNTQSRMLATEIASMKSEAEAAAGTRDRKVREEMKRYRKANDSNFRNVTVAMMEHSGKLGQRIESVGQAVNKKSPAVNALATVVNFSATEHAKTMRVNEGERRYLLAQNQTFVGENKTLSTKNSAMQFEYAHLISEHALATKNAALLAKRIEEMEHQNADCNMRALIQDRKTTDLAIKELGGSVARNFNRINTNVNSVKGSVSRNSRHVVATANGIKHSVASDSNRVIQAVDSVDSQATELVEKFKTALEEQVALLTDALGSSSGRIDDTYEAALEVGDVVQEVVGNMRVAWNAFTKEVVDIVGSNRSLELDLLRLQVGVSKMNDEVYRVNETVDTIERHVDGIKSSIDTEVRAQLDELKLQVAKGVTVEDVERLLAQPTVSRDLTTLGDRIMGGLATIVTQEGLEKSLSALPKWNTPDDLKQMEERIAADTKARYDSVSELLVNLLSPDYLKSAEERMATLTKRECALIRGSLQKLLSLESLNSVEARMTTKLNSLLSKGDFASGLKEQAVEFTSGLSSLPTPCSSAQFRTLEEIVVNKLGSVVSKEDFSNGLKSLPTPCSSEQFKTLEEAVTNKFGSVLSKEEFENGLANLTPSYPPQAFKEFTGTITTALANVATKDDVGILRAALPKRTHRDIECDDEDEDVSRQQRARRDDVQTRPVLDPAVYGDLLKVKAFTDSGLLSFANLSPNVRAALRAWVMTLPPGWFARALRRLHSCLGSRHSCLVPIGRPDVACNRCVGSQGFCMRMSGIDVVMFPLHPTDRPNFVMADVGFWKREAVRKSRRSYLNK